MEQSEPWNVTVSTVRFRARSSHKRSVNRLPVLAAHDMSFILMNLDATRAGKRGALPLGMCTCITPLQPQTDWMEGSLLAARRGDGEAFTDLVSPHAPRLQRLARRLTRSHEDAEDVCQESLLKAFTKLDQFDGSLERAAFCAWLMRITANCAIDFLRRKKASRLIPLEECDPVQQEAQMKKPGGWAENPETQCTREEQLRMVAEILAELPAELRNVCLLRNMMELSTKEVAERLGISSTAVRMRLFRAHGQLRTILRKRNAGGYKRGVQ
jgi:RNA polymerase sigma-70 factor, ECF subfamily